MPRAPRGESISGNQWKERIFSCRRCLSDWELADWERALIVPTSIGPTSIPPKQAWHDAHCHFLFSLCARFGTLSKESFLQVEKKRNFPVVLVQLHPQGYLTTNLERMARDNGFFHEAINTRASFLDELLRGGLRGYALRPIQSPSDQSKLV